jgi:hypothetical protein
LEGDIVTPETQMIDLHQPSSFIITKRVNDAERVEE